MKDKMNVAIIGPGQIGIDLMMKIQKTDNLNLVAVASHREGSLGLRMAAERGVATTAKGVQGLFELDEEFDLVFDCTSASGHKVNGPVIREHNKFAVDLTPAAIGPLCVPTVNLDAVISEANETMNANMITCGGQAITPLAYAVQRVTPVHYAEMVTGAPAAGVGPAGRSNSHEFKVTTRKALLEIAGVETAKVINIINPAVPPAIMRNTLYTVCDLSKYNEICESIYDMVHRVQQYVPGYNLKMKPQIYDDHLVIMNEVASAGDYLPAYAGNLDIITAAGVAVAKAYADKKLGR